jgi:hypothetical protein
MTPSNWILDIETMLKHATALGEEQEAAAAAVNARAHESLDKNLGNGKLLLISMLKFLQVSFPGPPPQQVESDKESLILLLAFVQGHAYVEQLICEGQYVKACPALRQDYEFRTRMRELRLDTGRPGKPLNVANAPQGSQRFYGQLSKVVHPQTPALLLNFLQSWEHEDSLAVSHLPHFVGLLAAYLWTIHVWTTFEIAREALLLYAAFYGTDSESIKRATFELERATWSLEAGGFEFVSAEAPEPERPPTGR